MEEKTNELLKLAKEIYGDEADLLILAQQNQRCGVVVHGDYDNIAKSIFAAIHTPNNQMGAALYRILKNVIINTLNNPTAYSADLLNAIQTVLSQYEE